MVVQGSLCALASACVKVPPFQPQDAAPGDGDASTDADMSPATVNVEPSGAGGAIVTAPGYVMEFGSGGSRFPYRLDVGGQSLMGGSQQCADENAMGIALHPVYRVDAVDSPGMGTPTLTIPLAGPVVRQVRVQWSGAYSCGAGGGGLSGPSTFSFFPDGRLTRFDVITNAAARDVTDCSVCTPNGSSSTSFYLTSYTTLVVDGNAFLSDGTLANLTSYGDQVSNPGSTACVRERGQSVAFAWTNMTNRLRVAKTTPDRTIAFVHDLYAGATVPAQSWEAMTQMGISAAEDCATVEARIGEFSADAHQLSINGTAVGAALGDGIYGGDPRDDGHPVDFPVTLRAVNTTLPRIPAGFAVWLYSSTIPQPLTLTHSGGHTGTSWYREQRVGQNSVVFWFDVPLEQGETITISQS